MHLAIVGIRGVPNNYGGFETLTECLIEYLASEMDITVYCSSVDMDSDLATYKGAHLNYIHITSHGASGIIYDSVSLLKAVNKFDKVLFLGFGAGFVVPFLKSNQKQKLILNIGGLDWKRNKWSPFAQKVIKKAEQFLVRSCKKIIADNAGIQEYIKNVYHKDSTLIAYGGDQAIHRAATDEAIKDYPFLQYSYAFTVTRIQSDNNIEMILESFLNQNALPLVIVGNWDNSDYGRQLKQRFHGKKNLILLDAIYDRKKLDILRSNCAIYIHGHSAGGTNPSLTEAMYLGLPVFAFASGYNEHTTNNKAIYFKNGKELVSLIINCQSYPLKQIGAELKEFAKVHYVWKNIADQYKQVILS
jgi:glycosyltransferase involved in cell wall biosynthesis